MKYIINKRKKWIYQDGEKGKAIKDFPTKEEAIEYASSQKENKILMIQTDKNEFEEYKIPSKKKTVSKITPKKATSKKAFEFQSSKLFEEIFPEIKPDYDSDPILEINDLSVVFKSGLTKFKAVNNVSFDIYKGEVLGLVGESGSGKTTIGRTIMGLNSFSTGSVKIKGRYLNQNPKKTPKWLKKELVKEVQMIFQDPYDSLNPSVTIFDVIAEGLKNRDVKSETFLNNIWNFLSLDLIKWNLMLLVSKDKTKVKDAKEYAKIFTEVLKLKQEKNNKILTATALSPDEEKKIAIYNNQKLISGDFLEAKRVLDDLNHNQAFLMSQMRTLRKENNFTKEEELLKVYRENKQKIFEVKNDIQELDNKKINDLKIVKEELKKHNKNKTEEEVAKQEEEVSKINKDYDDKIATIIKKSLDKVKKEVDKLKISEDERDPEIKEFLIRTKEQTELLTTYKDNIDSSSKIIKNSVVTMLRSVGLSENQLSRYPLEFSGGQMQRIGIARTFVLYPELIIADEPISALDVSIQAQVINILNDLKDLTNVSVLFIAHDLRMVKYISDRIAVMHLGKIVEIGTSEEIFKNPLHPYTISLLSNVPSIDNIGFLESKQNYSPSIHDYSQQKPKWFDVSKNHKVFCSEDEFKKWNKKK